MSTVVVVTTVVMQTVVIVIKIRKRTVIKFISRFLSIVDHGFFFIKIILTAAIIKIRQEIFLIYLFVMR
jgi:hypothetical protein